MSFGLKVVNEKANVVIDDNLLPYRFTLIKALPQQISIGPNPYYGIHVPNLTPTSMVAIDTAGAAYKRRNFSGNLPYKNPPVVMEADQGGFNLVLQEEGALMRADWWEFITPPEVYVVDRVAPELPAGGFGMNVFDAAGDPLLTSATPLVKVIANSTVRTPATAGTAENTLLLIHTPPPTSNMSYYQYPGSGSGTAIFGGAFTEQTVLNGQHHVNYVVWEEEAGESPTYWDSPVSLMVSLIEKPFT